MNKMLAVITLSLSQTINELTFAVLRISGPVHYASIIYHTAALQSVILFLSFSVFTSVSKDPIKSFKTNLKGQQHLRLFWPLSRLGLC